MSWWQYAREEEYNAERRRLLQQQMAATQQRPLVSFLEPGTGQLTPGSALTGALDVLQVPAQAVGKPLLGLITEALTPGQQIQYQPTGDWWQDVQQLWHETRRVQEERPELFGFDIPENVPLIGGTRIGEKFITENILFDPLNWLGWGGGALVGKAARVARAAMAAQAAGDIAKATRLARQAQRLSGIGRAGRAIDVATTPLAWPGVAARGLEAVGHPGLAQAARWAGRGAMLASAPALAAAAPWLLVEMGMRGLGRAFSGPGLDVPGRELAFDPETGEMALRPARLEPERPRIFVRPADVEQRPPRPGLDEPAGLVLRAGVGTREGWTDGVPGQPVRRVTDLPVTVYHVTTDVSTVRENKLLRAQVHGEERAPGVSFTTNRQEAELLERELKRAGEVARVTTADEMSGLLGRASTEDGGFPDAVAMGLRAYEQTGDPLRGYAGYVSGREGAGGPGSPASLMTLEQARQIDPRRVARLRVLAYDLFISGALVRTRADMPSEIRVDGDVPIRQVEQVAPKGQLQQVRVGEAQLRIEDAERRQEMMVAANAIARRKGLTVEQKVAALVDIGMDESAAREALTRRRPFGPSQMSRNRADLKRLRARLAKLEGKQAVEGPRPALAPVVPPRAAELVPEPAPVVPPRVAVPVPEPVPVVPPRVAELVPEPAPVAPPRVAAPVPEPAPVAPPRVEPAPVVTPRPRQPAAPGVTTPRPKPGRYTIGRRVQVSGTGGELLEGTITGGLVGRRIQVTLDNGEVRSMYSKDVVIIDEQVPVPQVPPPLGEDAVAGPVPPEIPARPVGEGMEGQPPQPPGVPPTPPAPLTPEPPLPSDGQLELLRQSLARRVVPLRERAKQAWDVFVREAYDKLYPLKEIERKTGIPTYSLARILPGSQAWGERLVEKHVQPVLARVGADVRHLEEYMVATRMEDALKVNPKMKLAAGVKDPRVALAELADELGPERFAQIEEAATELWRLNDELILRPYMEAGIISRKVYDAIRARWPHFIPFFRQDFAWEDTFLASPMRHVANVSEHVIHVMSKEGSEKLLDRPLARWVAQVAHTQTKIARNTNAETLVEALRQYDPTQVKIFSARRKPGEPGPRETTTRGIINWYQKGVRRTAEVPIVFATIAKGLDYEPANALGRFLVATSRPLRMGAVQLNPVALITNPIRDAISAWFREGLIPLSPEWIRGLTAAITRNLDFDEAARAGVLMSGITELPRDINKIPITPRLGSIQVNNTTDALLVLPRLLMRANEVAEQATRIAVFHKLWAGGKGLDKLEAAIRARDATVDFARSGNTMQAINQVVLFANAGLHGSANTVRMIKTNPRLALLRASPLAMASIICYLWNQRYETAAQIPDYEHANAWVFQIGEGEHQPDPQFPDQPPRRFPIYIRIPKGSMGAVLTAPVEALLKIAWGQGDRSVVEHLIAAASTSARALLPIEPTIGGVLPPIIGTPVQVAVNRDIFRDMPIVPQAEMARPPEERYDETTSRTAIAMGQAFKVDPRMIDFAIRDYTAGAGVTANWLLDTALGALGYNPDIPGEAQRRELTPVEQVARTPMAGRFLGVRGTQPERLGYERLHEVLADTRRQLYRNPEVRRFGMGFNPPGEAITIDGVAQPLTLDQRTMIVEQSLPLIQAAFDKVIQRPFYRVLSDIEKRKVLENIRQRIHDHTRQAVTGQTQEVWDEQIALALVDAIEQKRQYDAIPAYVGLSPEQVRMGTRATAQISALSRANPQWGTDRIRLLYRQTDPQGEAISRLLSRQRNPARQQFWANHPLLSYFFGPQIDERLQQMMQMNLPRPA